MKASSFKMFATKFCLATLTIGLYLATPAGARAQTFTQITSGEIVNDLGNWIACYWGDFHNSGFLDLIAPNYRPGTNGFYQNSVGVFLKISEGNPVQDSGYHVAALGADYDNDGYVDLLVVNHGLPTANGGTNLLFHNNGDGTFTPITTGAIVHDVIPNGFCPLWEDYDNDGWPDLLLTSYASNTRNFLYHNNQNGTFTRVLTNIIATDVWPQGAPCGTFTNCAGTWEVRKPISPTWKQSRLIGRTR